METHYREMEALDKEENTLSMSHDHVNVTSSELSMSHDPMNATGSEISLSHDSVNITKVTEHVDSDVEEDPAGIEWKAVQIQTEWGVTDDVITLGNGKSHYFFKIPHKVGVCTYFSLVLLTVRGRVARLGM